MKNGIFFNPLVLFMLLNNLPTIFRLFYPHFGTFFVNFCHCKTIPKCILQSLKEKCCSTPIDFWEVQPLLKNFEAKNYNHFAIWHLGLAKKFPQMIQKIIHCFLTICFMLVWQLVVQLFIKAYVLMYSCTHVLMYSCTCLLMNSCTQFASLPYSVVHQICGLDSN